jgi:drug/metabolite transporter (DMT)-like permease
MKNIMLCLLAVVLTVCGQMFFKLGAQEKEISSIPDILKLFLSPMIIIAVTLYVGTTILWVYILSKMPLSYAYPFIALAFPLVIAISSFLFHESVPVHRWVGVGIIVFGTLLASK